MAHKGKIQLMFTIIAPPDQVEEGDRIFRSHAPWIEATHHRTGDKALLSYDVSKAPELKNPLDPSAGVTGNTCYVLNEIYESEAGVRTTSRRRCPAGKTSRLLSSGWGSARPRWFRRRRSLTRSGELAEDVYPGTLSEDSTRGRYPKT